MAAIKSMAALFTAFDRPNYQKLIPQHPVKARWANSTKVYEKRYEHTSPPIIKTSIPPGWISSTVIMERMFLTTSHHELSDGQLENHGMGNETGT